MSDKSGRQLAIPRSGSQKLVLSASGAPDPAKEIVIAAWQTQQHGIPKRMVIRIDGNVTDPFIDEARSDLGFPCGMVQVRYSIGGFVREVLVDATNQSALTVWAETIEVQAIWDRRRIQRLNDFYSISPCSGQMVAASISGCDCGDTGIADARWLDVLGPDIVTEDPSSATSRHIVPNGARGVRFLNGRRFSTGTTFPTVVADPILFLATDSPHGFVEAVIDGVTFQSIINVPTTAKIMSNVFGGNFFDDPEGPMWIEWVMSPITGNYY